MSGQAVLIHGAGGGAWEWAIWSRVLTAAGWNVRARDLVPAASGLAATRLHDYVEQATAWLAGSPRAAPRVLIGASLGGLIAARIAQDIAIDALVLINPMPPTPWHTTLPMIPDRGAVIPWGRDASLDGTRRALPDADDATCLDAWRRWRDESAAVITDAHAGVVLAPPRCPVLFIASTLDGDVPAATTAAWAVSWRSSLMYREGASHVGPLLGQRAAPCARLVSAWLASVVGFAPR